MAALEELYEFERRDSVTGEVSVHRWPPKAGLRSDDDDLCP